ncbi:MAG TPA: hypothetical protein VJC16_03625 [Candidatus Nanoarchaeia archaeon]|nr:hypothetical protein [Candidatus Nanoarchaeia archaeon]
MIACKTKRWGNSVGVILPRDVVREKNIKPEEDILLDILEKRTVLRELFGALRFKKTTRDLLAESRKGLSSKFDAP